MDILQLAESLIGWDGQVMWCSHMISSKYKSHLSEQFGRKCILLNEQKKLKQNMSNFVQLLSSF